MLNAPRLKPRAGWFNRIIFYGLAAVGLAAALIWALVAYQGIRTIEDLVQKNEILQEAITELTLETQIGYAKVIERRVEDDSLVQKIRFVETAWEDPSTEVIRRDFEIRGEEIYFDAMIVKFDSELVQDGNERALYLWRRIYSEEVPPENGFPIEEPGAAPERYRQWLAKLPVRQRNLFWSEIWALSNHPNKLEDLGITAIYGNALYQRMEPGRVYLFRINNAGQIYPQAVPDL